MKQKKQKLPERIKAKWLKALRSGEYNQGTGYLLEIHSQPEEKFYCCLGVLGKVCGNEDIDLLHQGTLNEFHKRIPKLVMGPIEENDLVKKLTKFNDCGKSFKWIAAYIERYL